jgi:hypothetical protein
LLALTALITELAVIGGTNNQGVTDWVNRNLGSLTPNGSLADNLAISSQTFRWRFMYAHDAVDTVASDYVRNGIVLALSALLIAVLVRGSITFGRAFFATWASVVVAAVVAVPVAAVLRHEPVGPHHNAVGRIFNSGLGLSSFDVVGALALGFVVALVVALLAVGTRRTVGTVLPLGAEAPVAPPAPYVEPAAPPPWNPEQPTAAWAPPPVQDPPFWTTPPQYRQPEWTRESAETVQLGAVADTETTTALPAVDEAQATTTLPPFDEATAVMPDVDAATSRWPASAEDPEDVRIDEDDLTPH